MTGFPGTAVPLALALLVLSACAEFATGTDRAPGSAPAQANASAHSGDRDVLDPELRPTVNRVVPPLPEVPVRKPREYPAQPPTRPFVADPQQLLGLDFAATKALLGEPASYVDQPPAKVWAYNAGICVLNVFFYPTVTGEKFSLLAYEVLDGAPAAEGASVGDAADASLSRTRSVEEILSQKAGKETARRCLAELLGSRDLPKAR